MTSVRWEKLSEEYWNSVDQVEPLQVRTAQVPAFLSQQPPTLSPLTQCIEDGYPNVFRTLSTRRVPTKNRPSDIKDIFNGSISDPTLPPIDGGRRAWLFMVAAFMVEGVLWGFPLTFGVFQSYYDKTSAFGGSRNFAIVGTLCTGISYLGTPLITPFTIKYPKYQQTMIWVGWLTCIFALIGSSFATQLWHLIITQGLMYGLGFLCIYYPLLSMLNEWFDRRRGLAYGIMFASAGICGLGLPFLIEKLLNHYGHAVTLRAYGIAIFVLVGPTLPLLRGRVPPEDIPETRIDKCVFTKPIFFAMTFSNLFQGLVFFLPSIFLSSYASSINLNSAQGTLTLSLLNLTQIFGQITMGYLSDRISFHLPMALSSLLSALAILLIWGFSKSLAPLLIFGLLYGLLAGGYSVLYCRFVTALTSDRATGLWLYSIFEFQRGLGNIIGGVASGALIRSEINTEDYGVGKYKDLILVIGIAMLVSSLGGFGWFFTLKTAEINDRDGDKERLVAGSNTPSIDPSLKNFPHELPPLELEPMFHAGYSSR